MSLTTPPPGKFEAQSPQLPLQASNRTSASGAVTALSPPAGPSNQPSARVADQLGQALAQVGAHDSPPALPQSLIQVPAGAASPERGPVQLTPPPVPAPLPSECKLDSKAAKAPAGLSAAARSEAAQEQLVQVTLALWTLSKDSKGRQGLPCNPKGDEVGKAKTPVADWIRDSLMRGSQITTTIGPKGKAYRVNMQPVQDLFCDLLAQGGEPALADAYRAAVDAEYQGKGPTSEQWTQIAVRCEEFGKLLAAGIPAAKHANALEFQSRFGIV